MRKRLIVVTSILSLIGFVGCSKNPVPSTENPLAQVSPGPKPAEESLDPIVDLHKAALLNVQLGLAYLEQKQMKRSKQKLNRALSLAPQLQETHSAMAYFLETIGEKEGAKKAYLKAIALDPEKGQGHNNYGAFLCKNGDYQGAEQEFLRAVQDPLYPNNAEAYENAAICILQLPDKSKAKHYFRKALKQDPNRPMPWLELAQMAFEDNDFQLAQMYQGQYERLGNPNARSLILGIKLAKIQKDKDKEASLRLLLKSKFPHANENAPLNSLSSRFGAPLNHG